MAGGSPTASIATTLGVAFATLLVMGGILAGPAILDCSADTRGFGACLRDRMTSSGLVAPEAEGLDKPVAVVETPPPPAPEPGWMGANATELEGEAPAAATLTAPTGLAEAGGAAPVVEMPIAAALTAPAGTVEASGTADIAAIDAASALVTAMPEGTLSAATASAPEPAPAEAELIGRPPPAFEQPLVQAAVETPLAPEPTPAPTPPPAPEPPAAPEPAPVAIVEPPPPPIIRFDPQYPNVLVLPAPAEGDDSSFRTLQLN